MATKVKICGITRLEDAELALSGGAWAIGLIMHEASPRFCAVESSAQIAAAMRRKLEVVGVFVNAPLEHVVARADEIPLTMLQLHGEEGPAYCAELARSTGLKVIKVARVRNAASVRELATFKTSFHMLDTYVEGTHGGTGESFEWGMAASHPGKPPLILSGGLNPDNVGVAIEQVQPFVVDVSSGVEASPGIKDPSKLRAFFDAVARATAAAA
jgi:phosphoribosylanthranilate isomerase